MKIFLIVAFAFCASTPAKSASEVDYETFLSKAAPFALGSLGPVPIDKTNRFFDNVLAQDLGKQLFHDPGLSKSGQISCASCHVTKGVMTPNENHPAGRDRKHRPVMPIIGSAYQSFLFWDGRADSLWSQALEPLEHPQEHDLTRTEVVNYVQENHQSRLQELSIESVDAVKNLAASPLGDQAERDTWAALSPDIQTAVNRSFSDIGKVIAAYEASLPIPESKWDQWIKAAQESEAHFHSIPDRVVKGFMLFDGKARCSSCHNGPLFSDKDFHNTGLPSVKGLPPDLGKQAAMLDLIKNPFNCLGQYSDADADQCPHLLYQNRTIEHSFGSFRTPSLRGVSKRTKLGHAGQKNSIHDMLRHYISAPDGPYLPLIGEIGASELSPLNLTDEEILDLVAFLENI